MAKAQVTITVRTWTGLGPDNYTTTVSNWLGRNAPTNDGSEWLSFGKSANQTVYFGTALTIDRLVITGNTTPYIIDDDNYEMFLGAGGLYYNPAAAVNSVLGAYRVQATADQPWDIRSGEISLYYDLSGSGRIEKTGNGSLVAPYNYNWTGGITLTAGTLVLETYGYGGQLGSGPLVIGPTTSGGIVAPRIVARDPYGGTAGMSIANSVQLNGILTTENQVELTLGGAVTLNTDTTISSIGEFLFLDNKISDGPATNPAARKVTIDTYGPVAFTTGATAPNDYTGGTHVANGQLVFAEGAAVPDTGLITVSATGYAGYGDNSGNAATEFLAKLDPLNVHGSIGFDTDPMLYTANTFTTPINLTGFAADARLGSATEAILSPEALITPQGNDYRFGGGGGNLMVRSLLTNGTAARNVVADSPAGQPLTVRVWNVENSFTGTVSATNSAIIFDRGALPAGTGSFTLGAGGYIGSANTYVSGPTGDADVASYLAHFAPGTNSGIIGFDNSYGFTGQTFPVAINLSAFSGAVYIGTATPGDTSEGISPGVILTGTITPAGPAGSPFRFAGYKGGLLGVSSSLTGTGGLVIGDPNSPATFGDLRTQTYSTVYLSGDNSGLSGSTHLYAGMLMLGQGSGVAGTDPITSIGAGPLVVHPFTLPSTVKLAGNRDLTPVLALADSYGVIDRPIQLEGDLGFGNGSPTRLQLTGAVTGVGGFQLSSYAELVLINAANTFSGGVRLGDYSSLTLDSDLAGGTGDLVLGSGATLLLKSTAPVIGNLSSGEGNTYGYVNFAVNDTILTINQSVDGSFAGNFRPDYNLNPNSNESFRVVKNGPGTLTLVEGSFQNFSAPVEAALPGSPEVALQINEGKVLVEKYFNFYSGTAAIWVHGGTLALQSDYYTIFDPVIVDNGGRLEGSGRIDTASIGVGATISPGGVNGFSIGTLSFADLVLGAGGTYEWNLMDASQSVTGLSDRIVVYSLATLTIAATAADPFVIKLSTVGLDSGAGLAANFDPTQPFSWTLFSSNNTANFDPSKFTIDASGFANSLSGGPAGNGYFFLSLGGTTGQDIVLNFTPVPEPSTWALLLLGLGLAPLAARRRRG